MIKHRQPEDMKYLFKKAEREYPYKAVSDTSTGNVVFSQVKGDRLNRQR